MIQETKINNREFQNLIATQKNYEGIATDSNGALGGIGTLWNKWNWKIISQKLNNSWVRKNLIKKNTNITYTVINIYSLNHYRDKGLCWESLKEEVQNAQIDNLIMGGI